MDHATKKGTLVVDGDLGHVVFERKLRFPIEAVWQALTDPQQRAQWFGKTTIDGKEGGALSMIADGPPAPEEMRKMHGAIVVWDPPHVLEHKWNQKHLKVESTIRYELSRDGDGTLLKLSHRGLRLDDARGYIPGEHAYLDRLEAALSSSPVPGWQARYAEVAGLYGPPPSWGPR